jgi:ABC-2 type transport system permease protein
LQEPAGNIPTMSTAERALDTSHELRRIRGPSALGGDPRRFIQLARTLAITDFKLKFYGSVLGYLWQLMRPLMLFGVLYVVFTQLVRLGGETVPHYPAVLLTGIVTYGFFAAATGGSVGAVLNREALVRKIEFPRLVIPLSVVLVAYFDLLLNFMAVFIFVLADGVEPRWSWLELIPLLTALGVLATGIGMLLSALYVRYRDVEPIWEVALQILFYASPILYVITLVPEEYRNEMVALNPIATVLTQMRHALIDRDAPSAVDVLGGWPQLAIPLAIVAAVFALGAWVFARETPRIAENL